MKKKILLYISPLFFLTALFFLCQTEKTPIVWQSYTSAHETLIGTLVPKDEKIQYLFKGKEIKPFFERSFKKWNLHHLKIKKLNLRKNYKLTIKNKKSKYEYDFKSFNWNKKSFTIAVASCMNDRWDKKQIQNMWKGLLSFQPDLILLIGDNVYADRYIPEVNPKHLEKRYLETWKTLPIYKSSSLLPILAIWDDHDYGMGNGNKSFKHKRFITNLFRDFFPLPKNSRHLQKGPGISFRVQTPYQNFLFMDGRSYRDQNSQGSLWGHQQEKWLNQNLKQRELNWIISGGQVFGKHHQFESLERDFPRHFKRLMKKLKKPTLVVSGDRHLGELLKEPRSPIYELTTSPIHAKIYPRHKDFKESKRHIHHVPNQLNFAIIRHTIKKEKFDTKLQLYGLDKNLIFSHGFKDEL